MRFSVWAGLSQPWADVLAVASHADATGWDGVYVADHFMGDAGGPTPETEPTFEATAALAALAAATSKVRIASLVFSVTYRHPAVLAKWASTVDHISGGRLLLGVGAGWQVNEHEQYGIPLGPPGERIARFVEALTVLRGLLADERTTAVGDHYVVQDALAEPKPVQSPLPLLIGGKGDRMLRSVVPRFADEWNLWSSPSFFASRREVVEAGCEAIGRDPASIRKSTQALVFVVDDEAKAASLAERVPRPVMAGSYARIASIAASYRDAGVDELIIPDFTLGSGQQKLEHLEGVLTACRGL